MPPPKDPRKGTLLMLVNQQKPVHNVEQPLNQPPVMKINGTSRGFIMHDPSQKTNSGPSEVSSQQGGKSTSHQPYTRIRWVNSDAVLHTSDANGTEVREYQAPKRRRLEPKQPKKPLLTVKRPIKNAASIHEDAWRLILTFSDPKLLLRMRYVSSMFRNILRENNIWKKSRENHFDDGVPDCPFFLTELQYVDLLVGCGCQNKKCLRRETRKAYWIFGGRLCEDCLRQRTSTESHEDETAPQAMYADLFSDRQSKEQYGTSLVDLIPSALHEGGKYYAPRRTLPNGKWHMLSLRSRQWLYLKSDYAKIEEEFASIKNQSWSPEQILEWTKEKYNRAVRYAKVAEELMEWETSRLRSHQHNVTRNQSAHDRAEFFRRKAESLIPPIRADILPIFAAYEAALKTCNQPSDRAWDVLLPKILPYREQALRIKHYKDMQFDCNHQDEETTWPEDARLFQRLHNHRYVAPKETGDTTPEQRFVLEMAKGELARLQNNVADEDLVLLCLRNTYDRYQMAPYKPHGLNYDGTVGPYKLSLDDARMIVEEVIKAEVDRKTLQSVKVLDSFRCSGCTRANVTRKWSFEEGFEHILQKHSTTVGKDLHYSRFARNFVNPGPISSHAHYRPFRSFLSMRFQFPWYLLEWTRTLPLLPAHALVTKETKWLPDSDEPYVQLGSQGDVNAVSAFSGRHAVRQFDIEPADFEGNFIRVAKLFSSTTLDGPMVTRIALRYSLELNKIADASVPSLDQFLACLVDAQKGNLNMNLKYKCGLCSNDPQVNKHLRFAKTPVDTNKLRLHWESKHAKDRPDWTRDLMNLPDDCQVLDTMRRQDAQLEQMQAQSTERETVGLQRTVRKVPDQKASAIMGKEMSIDIFNTLFEMNASQ